jgi:hypothetical protein
MGDTVDKIRFQDQLEVMYKCLRNLANVPVLGNVYQGGVHSDAFLEIADGVIFENWLWFWADGSPLSDSTRRTIQQRVERVLADPSKCVVLHVPCMPANQVAYAQVAYAQERILDMLDRYGPERVLFYEHTPARNTVSVRRVMQGLA